MERAYREAMHQLEIANATIQRLAEQRAVIKRELQEIGYVGFSETR